MLNQNIFMETLREVKEIVRTAPEPLTEEEMLAYFKDMDLSDEQKAMVCTYLVTQEEEPVLNEEEPDEADAAGENENSETAEDYLPDSKVFKMYLEELESLPKVKNEALGAMYIRLLRGDEKVIGEITNAWMKKVLEKSKEFASPKYSLEDVIQEGNMGLFIRLTQLCGSNEAIDVEDALAQAVESAMKAYISDITGEDDSEQTVVGKANLINEAKKYLTEQNGSEPSLQELSDYTRMDVDELADILEIITKAEKKG